MEEPPSSTRQNSESLILKVLSQDQFQKQCTQNREEPCVKISTRYKPSSPNHQNTCQTRAHTSQIELDISQNQISSVTRTKRRTTSSRTPPSASRRRSRDKCSEEDSQRRLATRCAVPLLSRFLAVSGATTNVVHLCLGRWSPQLGESRKFSSFAKKAVQCEVNLPLTVRA